MWLYAVRALYVLTDPILSASCQAQLVQKSLLHGPVPA